MKTITIITAIILLFGCAKELDTIQVIREGSHRVEDARTSRTDGQLSYSFTFMEYHKYLHLEGSDHFNKMPGLSSNRIHHNSIRVGWQQLGESFNLVAYEYLEGEWMPRKWIYTAQVGELLFIDIDTGDGRQLSVNGNVYTSNGSTCKQTTNFYFGGDPTSPKDLIFNIETQ